MCNNPAPTIRLLVTDGKKEHIRDFPFEPNLLELVFSGQENLSTQIASWLNELDIQLNVNWSVEGIGICTNCNGRIPNVQLGFEFDTPKALTSYGNKSKFLEEFSRGIVMELIESVIQESGPMEVIVVKATNLFRGNPDRNPFISDNEVSLN